MENRYKKIFGISFLFAFAISLFFPLSVLSADLSPKFNPLCWEKKECEEARAEFVGESNAKAAEGWMENQYPCDSIGWGMCLPANATVAQVSFGGSKQFKNVGEYIKTVYNYSLIMIGILAVVMIIIAGVQWISSGGNGEVIKQSRKRITGAVIGLFIAFMSYNILQAINPATVNLRLPQVYMVRQSILPSKWCRELDPKTDFAFGASHEKQKDEIKATQESAFNLKYPHDNPADKKFWCGQRYFIGGASPEAFCWGDRCDKRGVCTNVDPVDQNNPYMCRKGNVAGVIKAGGDVSTDSIVEDEKDIMLVLVCNNGTNIVVADEPNTTMDEIKGELGYIFGVDNEEINKAIGECGGATAALGFVLTMDFSVNNIPGYYEDHVIGKGGKDIGMIELFDIEDEIPLGKMIKMEHFIPISSVIEGTTVDIKGEAVKICATAEYTLSKFGDVLGVVWKMLPFTSGSGIESAKNYNRQNIVEVLGCTYTAYFDYYLDASKNFFEDYIKKYLEFFDKVN